MTTPRVSIVLPARNAARFLGDAIASVRAQTFTDWELIVVDDGSTDDTTGIILRAGFQDPRVILKYPSRVQRCHGIAATLNAGIACARSPLIARLDADDRMLPTRLERQVAFMDRHPEVGVLGTAWLEDLDDGMVSREIRERVPSHLLKHRRRACIPPQSDAVIRGQLRRRNPMGHPTVMFRRPLWEAVGGYDESFALAQDLDFWLKVSRLTRLANLVEPLTIRTLHDGQSSRRRRTRRRCETRVRWRAIRSGALPVSAVTSVLRSGLGVLVA